uniref:Transposase n=1 Tax=Romanomermis culicivorax TaxID=13658 RepID=A0A915JTG5_ROMCU
MQDAEANGEPIRDRTLPRNLVYLKCLSQAHKVLVLRDLPCHTSSDCIDRCRPTQAGVVQQSDRAAIRHWAASADTGLQFRSS